MSATPDRTIDPASRPAAARRSRFGLLWLIGWLALGGLLLASAGPRPGGVGVVQTGSVLPVPTAEAADDSALESHATGASTPQVSGRRFLAIEDMRLGRRVKAHNPLPEDTDRHTPEPTPETHRAVSFRLAKHDGDVVDFDLLCSLDWLQQVGAESGGTVYFDLEELGGAGLADVLAIRPCPPIHPGKGAVVTGLYRHTAQHVLNLSVEGDSEPLGVTANHPIWSEDRHSFVPAGQLRTGEKLRTSSGRLAALTSITPRGPPEAVYNLQVHGEHVYHVGASSVLVHNKAMSVPGSSDELVTIVHGTSLKYADDIATNGLDAAKARVASINNDDRFFTHSITKALDDSDDAFWAATQWARQRHAGEEGVVLVGTIRKELLDNLKDAGQATTRSVPGLRFFPLETYFSPEAFKVLNDNMVWKIMPIK